MCLYVCVMSEGNVWLRCKITSFGEESLVLTWKVDFCEDESSVMQLCLEKWREMEHHFTKCVLAIKKNCNLY